MSNRPTALELRTGGKALRVTILLTMQDHARHRSMMTTILREAKQAGIAGATVYEGDLGFGASGRLHQVHVLSDDRPLAIVIIDREVRVAALLDQLERMLAEGQAVVVSTEIDVVATLSAETESSS